jgi:hypothetical protein
LAATESALTDLYFGWLPRFAEGQMAAEPLKVLNDIAATSLEPLLSALKDPSEAMSRLSAWPGLQIVQSWAALMQPVARDGHPTAFGSLELGLARTYGGVGEALGLGPMLELNEAFRALIAAALAKQQATTEYLGVVADACAQGTHEFMKELQAMGERGDRVESLLAFIRLWVRSIDGPMHDAMQSRRGLDATAKMLRSSTEHTLLWQKALGIVSEALHVPTRHEVDAAFREIQELKRELRRLKHGAPVPGRMALLPLPETPAEKAAMPPAARKTSARKSARRQGRQI